MATFEGEILKRDKKYFSDVFKKSTIKYLNNHYLNKKWQEGGIKLITIKTSSILEGIRQNS